MPHLISGVIISGKKSIPLTHRNFPVKWIAMVAKVYFLFGNIKRFSICETNRYNLSSVVSWGASETFENFKG